MFRKAWCLTAVLVLALAAVAYSADWQKYGENQYGAFYYDKDSTQLKGLDNVLRFMTKWEHADSEAYTLRQFEFDCLHRLYRILKCEVWEKGATGPKYCGTFEYWNAIPPNTYTLDLYNNICPKKRGFR